MATVSAYIVSWVVLSGETNSLTMVAYGPFAAIDAAMEFIEKRPAGFISNVYELHTPMSAAVGNNEDKATVDRLVLAFDHFMRPSTFEEQAAWLDLKAAMYAAGWREAGA